MARLSRHALLGAVAAWSLVVGCGGEGPEDGGGGSGDPGFAIQVIDPASGSVAIAAGGDTAVWFAVTVPEGQERPSVYLRVEDLPDGVYYRAGDTGIPASEGQGYIWFFATDDAPQVEDVEVRVIGSTLHGDEAETTLRMSVTGGIITEPGCPDPTFGPLGCITTAVVGEGPVLGDVVVTPDGSIVAVGYRADGKGFVAKWDARGMPDIDYGQGGVGFLTVFLPTAAAALPDGRVVLGGVYADDEVADLGTPVIAIFTGGGLGLDPYFNFVPVASGPGLVRSIAVIDGVIHVSTALAGGGGHVLVRLDTTGQQLFAPTFDGPSPDVSAFAANGSLVAGTGSDVFRFDAEGHWDTTFGAGGLRTLDGFATGAVLPVDASGGFWVTGRAGGSAPVARILANGAIDPEFGFALARDGANIAGLDLVELSDGGAVIAEDTPSRVLELVLFDENGQARTGYGDGGVIAVPFLAQTPAARLAVDRQGAVLAAAVVAPDAIGVARIPR